MRRWAVVLSALSVTIGAATTVAGNASAGNDNDPYTLSDGHAGPMSGVVPARGEAGNGHGHGGGGSSPNLTWHGGPVQSNGSTVIPIFWGTSWNGTSSVLKINYLTDFYQGVGGSGYMQSNTEYNGTTSAKVSASVSWGGSFTDPTAAPSRAPSTATILGEVAKMTGNNPVPGAYYPVYIDRGRGSAGYCAWHSAGTVSNIGVQFGFFFNLDGDSGCDPQDTQTGNPPGVAALGNVTGHELSEMVTDPLLNAWYDSQGAENADKCAWTFDSGYLANFGGHSWKIQGNWSNAAYTAKTGYANGGCISHS
jgi:hypothetical protein